MCSKDSDDSDTTTQNQCADKISPQREAIYWRAEKHKNSLRTTFKRNYFAAQMTAAFGWGVQLFTTGIGAALIYLITQSSDNTIVGLSTTDLAVLILVATLVMTFYEPKLRSRTYYNAGQSQQELYDDFVAFIEIQIPNRDNETSELEARLTKLNSRRHRLNQSTPQLAGLWYHLLRLIKWIKDSRFVWWTEPEEWKQMPLKERMCSN